MKPIQSEFGLIDYFFFKFLNVIVTLLKVKVDKLSID